VLILLIFAVFLSVAYTTLNKFTFWGVLTPKHYFSSSRPPKGTFLAETASYEPLSVAIGRGVSSGWRDKNTKGENQLGDKLAIGPAHALNPIITIFCMWGGPWTCF